MLSLLNQLTRWLDNGDIDLEILDAPSRLRFQATLEHAVVDVVALPLSSRRLHLVCWLPVRAPCRQRPALGEYLHRLNLTLQHLHWLLDPDNGAIACRHIVEIPASDQTAETVFHHELGRLLVGVDGMVPATLGVCGGGLRPAVAVDQAHAALAEFARGSDNPTR